MSRAIPDVANLHHFFLVVRGVTQDAAAKCRATCIPWAAC